MYSFKYTKAKSVAEASDLLSSDVDAKVLAGGMSLLPTMKLRMASPSILMDLSGIPELVGIERREGNVHIGAMTRHHAVASSAVVGDAINALASLAAGIGDVQVRNRGTVGGSVANADPAADYPAAVLGLGATVHTNRRTIAADDFFRGLFETALEQGEIVTSFTFPVPERAVYLKFANQASRFAVVGLFLADFGDEVRVAVTGAGPYAFRVRSIEDALSACFDPAEIAPIDIASDTLLSDIHAPADYRAHLIKVLAVRAVERCSQRSSRDWLN